MMLKRIKLFIFFAIISITTTLLLWLPFILNLREFWGIPLPQQGFATIAANFDGPYYIIAAKSLYNPDFIKQNYFFSLPPIYYSAYYPLYPLLIKALASLPQINYVYAMIIATIITSILAIWTFYHLLQDIGLQKQAFWLTVLFTIFPARWFVARSVGSPEPLFILSILASFYYFRRRNYWAAGIFGAAAQLTQSPGILLFFAYILALIIPSWNKLAHQDIAKWIRNLPWKAYPICLIPASLVSLFFFYAKQYDDFFAYFHSSNNIHLSFPPFQIFNPSQPWIGTFLLGEILWIYLIGALGLGYLIQQKQTMIASIVGIFFFSILFVSGIDAARYSLPMAPFFFITFQKLLSSNIFKWAIVLLVIPIYLFSLAFIANNAIPIADWSPLL